MLAWKTQSGLFTFDTIINSHTNLKPCLNKLIVPWIHILEYHTCILPKLPMTSMRIAGKQDGAELCQAQSQVG